MSKPDDISQAVWDAASSINLVLPYGHVQAEIARAITDAVAAEREACAAVADDLTPVEWEASLAAHVVGFGIARAIRSRSTP